ncbi:uncharacterized protein PV06_11116 [Exophiala oligosperma]|uniref:Small ribosomal subunit protein mS29 n=1 Tax=Exophiala oligosperma TaxID=215243 RepID=A0A0D2BGT7_9EURO|nr:uncharacterized protein PV06_11116 [Exophiala oligosperma]KIW36707.1 hypothetical protein PV06_11116 [Exophiala oligosperma]
MSLAICTECLSRLRISPHNSLGRVAKGASLLPQTASFHASATQKANPTPGKKGDKILKFRGSQSARLKKKVRERLKLPPVGERRAQRRRIVLSNTNALPVDDMENWNKGNITDSQLVGKVMGLDGELLDQLRDAKAFERTQNWNLFRRPGTLIRDETLAVGKEVETLTKTADSRVVKHLVVGDAHAGKSILMLQTICMAFMNAWLVLSVPEGEWFFYFSCFSLTNHATQVRLNNTDFPLAQDFINNTSSYAPLREKEGEGAPREQRFIQPRLAQSFPERALYSNETILGGLKINHELPKNITLKQSST